MAALFAEPTVLPRTVTVPSLNPRTVTLRSAGAAPTRTVHEPSCLLLACALSVWSIRLPGCLCNMSALLCVLESQSTARLGTASYTVTIMTDKELSKQHKPQAR